MIPRFHAANPPVHRASTVLFESVSHLDELKLGLAARDPKATMYGTMGTPTTQALADLVVGKEGGHAVAFTPSGLAAVTLALVATTRAGGHVLVPDSVYGPTRDLCEGPLARFGVTTEYYQPLIGAKVAELLRPNTTTVFLESPGSYTFEVQDVPGIAAAVRMRRPEVSIVMDNAYGSPGLFRPFDHGVDISVVPLTKYWGGHADLLVGAVVASSTSWGMVWDAAVSLGLCTNGDEAYLALRGARTVETRLPVHGESAVRVARWLDGHERVGKVLHPALPSCPGHDIWLRDFAGSNGLFAFELLDAARQPATVERVAAFVDRLVTGGAFGLGYSWGGFESLVMPAVLPGGPNIVRTVTPEPFSNLVRLHIGLEPVDRLIGALERALATP